MNPGNFFNELKRRNVFKVAAAYAIVGWLIIQIIVAISGPLKLPEWIPTFIIVLVGVGFPITLLIAWAFELTPEGLKKTENVNQSGSITPHTGKRIHPGRFGKTIRGQDTNHCTADQGFGRIPPLV
ncbi:MAG: hypothetical protein P8X57_09595 [Cyclobacteriaceae bacterium]